MPQPFAADLTPDLLEADEILTKYGRWAAAGPGPRTCGSAEGRYRPPGGAVLESRREPVTVPLDMAQRVAAQKSLARVPEVERTVLVILYIPHRIPVGARLRLAQIPPRLSRERHERGLRMWWNLFRALDGSPAVWQDPRRLG